MPYYLLEMVLTVMALYHNVYEEGSMELRSGVVVVLNGRLPWVFVSVSA